MTERVRIELLPQQYDYVADDDASDLLIHGGRGSAKTTGLCVKIARRASHKGACEGLFRQKLIDLRRTTLRVLLDGVGGMPPILPPGSYHHDKTEKIIRIKGGGEIVYNGLDQGDTSRQFGSTGKASSLNLSGAAIDEAVEVQRANVVQIKGAVRVKVPGLPLQHYYACNPSVPSSWLAEDFGLAGGHIAKEGHKAIACNPLDNYYLPPEFIRNLKSLTGVARERYLYGKWVGSDGLVYDKWDRQVHVTEKPDPPKRVVLGIDEGYTDPFVVVRIHLDSDGRGHIASEFYQSGLTEDEKIAAVREMLGSDEAECVVDSAAPALIESMRRRGLNALPANKVQGSVAHGINLVQTRLVKQGDGLPRLTVDPNCTNTIREFESYEWKVRPDGASKDDPQDRDNHAMDALRYAVMSLDTDAGPVTVSVGWGDEGGW